MKFQNFTYERVDFPAIEAEFDSLLEQFNKVASFGEQDEIMTQINHVRSKVESMSEIASIRN